MLEMLPSARVKTCSSLLRLLTAAAAAAPVLAGCATYEEEREECVKV
ncbi:hypothetical protein [Streptomyces nanshensis]|nr:hypothetical protein [Streptomyces nanshensis]